MGLAILITVNDAPHRQLTDMATRVVIEEQLDQPATYTIHFEIDICDNNIGQQLHELTDPGSIIGIIAEVNDQRICLVKGPVTTQNASLQRGGAGSSIDIVGADSTHDLDREHINRQWPDVTDADIVRTILSVVRKEQDVADTPDTGHAEENHTLMQRESNLRFIQRLAQRNGFHFWFTSDNEGQETGHFRPRSLEADATAILQLNTDNYNIENLSIEAQTARPTQATGQQLDLRNLETFGEIVTSSGDEALGEQSLQQIAGSGGGEHSTQLAPPTDDAGTLQARQTALLREASWFITATCSTTTHRLCKLIQIHNIVEIHGAGARHSGKYYVTGVRHTIDAAVHKMDLTLSRNAWGNQSGSDLLSAIF